MAEAEKYVSLEVKDGVASLTLNRPPLNVLDIPMMGKVKDVIEKAAKDPSIRVLLLKAEGKMFSAGVDVADHTPEKVGEMIPLFNQLCVALADFPAPTIAVVHGHALGGGCELVLCCDLAVIAEGAKIGQPEIHLAAIAPVAALRLPQIVGSKAAADILFTGRNLTAQEAVEIGLVNAVLPLDEVGGWANEKAIQISAMSGAAQKINKRALRMGMGDWAKALPEMEELYLKELMSAADAKEGLEAFLEKRPPVWKHE